MGGISRDLAEVFDYVNHELLLMKLKCYEIQSRQNVQITSHPPPIPIKIPIQNGAL
jgi:hypothetical protein